MVGTVPGTGDIVKVKKVDITFRGAAAPVGVVRSS